MLCLRVAALYKGVRWAVWAVWAGFTCTHVMRATIDLIGTSIFGGKLAHFLEASGLTPSFVVSMTYSHIGRQCLAGKLGKIGGTSPIISIFYAVIPTTLNLFLLTLTLVKAIKTTALSHSHPSSPIVCAVLNLDFWLRLTLIPQDARTVEPRDSVCGTVGIMHLILIRFLHRYFAILVRPPKHLEFDRQTVPLL